MLEPACTLPPLPPPVDLETVPILKALAAANRALAELKGRAGVIPNQGILIDTLSLQEAKASSEIENIVTTQDELFQARPFRDRPESSAAKEVRLYGSALKQGYDRLRETDGLIPNSVLIHMFRMLTGRDSGFRDTAGTVLKNDSSGEIVYVPPQDPQEVIRHMTDLERFINDDAICPLDPLVKMALIHHQFESIHPFADGNGRIGRILNVLYITRSGLLEIPVLYLSRHIMRTRNRYYRLLQAVREQGAWEEWVLYMLTAVAETAKTTLFLVNNIRSQMADVKRQMRQKLPRLYSQDLLNNLFRHPYTRIEFVANDLSVSRQTAARHLDRLTEHGLVEKLTVGRDNYYINTALVQLLMDGEAAG